jgi:AraC family transcriptional regulator of adaptative response/methylated-DNA-[protein]-cysteine methyltransferase
MLTTALPSRDEMLAAFLRSDSSYEGVFVTAVRTTGVFCRPTCPARKPLPANVEFFATARDALGAGYRACQRCRPLEPEGSEPEWLRPLLAEVAADPHARVRDADLRAKGLSPERVRRWFERRHGTSFQAYLRARRLGAALGRIRSGEPVTQAAFDAGYESLSGFHEAFTRLFGETPSGARSQPVIVVNRIATPLGPMLAGACSGRVCLLEFADRRMLATQIRRLRARLGASYAPGDDPLLAQLARELGEYFAGERAVFSVPLELAGTEFQRRVWTALLGIPSGETRSYAALARELGRPSAVRAVARANGDNRLAILVPCHRVVGSDGKLTGYGGGLWRKQRLLEHERGGIPNGGRAE